MNISWLVFACWLGWLAYWLVSAIGVKKTLRGKNGWRGIWIRLAVLIVLLLLYSSKRFQTFILYVPASANTSTAEIGALICVLGIAFAIWARAHLGKNWGMPMSVREKPDLITTGPYTFVRHPIYTGILLAMLGTSLVWGFSWFLLFIVCGFYFVYSATQEEKLMLSQFPNQYPEYKSRTKMIVPFLL